MKREGRSLTSDNKVSIKKLSYILRGSTRIKIFISLLDGIKTAREIEKETSVLLPSICRSLKGMVVQGILECLNINNTQGKLYKLSDDAITLAPIVIDKAKKKNYEISENEWKEQILSQIPYFFNDILIISF